MSIFSGDPPMQDSLNPLPPTRAAKMVAPGFAVEIAPEGPSLDGARITFPGQTEDLTLLSLLRGAIAAGDLASDLQPPADPDAAYSDALRAARDGQTAAAGTLFLALALSGHHVGGALHGLASALCKAGRHDEALRLSLTLGDAGFTDPRALILAGFAAQKTGDKALARKCLARAARMARGQPEYVEDLHFAQRLLLMQQLGD
ncbi:hypothetical protein [Marivita sp. GX14005]|uniref:hypothetical protein n=1 Tax=Marivita sp. GX14005 TaxID=2942276 RepID=UPI002018A8B1|nr:hypothetical protein [Marivita sp. GX14005]MCL3883322.1 hypothetical protein [Marivita sp. GX14005]